jgi:hypothetical protein
MASILENSYTTTFYQPTQQFCHSVKIDHMVKAVKNYSFEVFSGKNDEYKEKVIKRVIAEGVGYASLPYIVRKTKLSVNDAKRLLDSSKEFRKSYIHTKNGDEVYLINTPLSSIKDAWNAFRHLKAMKFKNG